MLKKNYPYKSKVVLTEKQASKEPIGSFYHPTEKTFRSGACPVGMTLKKGYHKKGYMKMNGTLINNTNVDPVCVKNKGLPGKLLKKDKEDFKEFGYLTSSNNNIRFKSLLEACKVLSYGTVMRKLNILKKRSSKKDDNKSIKLYNIYSSDILMLQKWRLKNPDLYKVKSELLLKGGQFFSKVKKIKIDKYDLKKVLSMISNYCNMTYSNALLYLFLEQKYKDHDFFKKYAKLSLLDVSEITDFNYLFEEGFNFNKARESKYDVDISGWELTNAKSMKGMFKYCTRFNEDLSSWAPYLVNVTNMEYMFFECTNFNQNLSSWGPYLGNVINMGHMFENCTSFNQDLSSWELGNVTNMEYMFFKCTNFNQDLSSWKLSNVTYMEYMFCYCNKFNQDLSSWGEYLGSVEDMHSMFHGCETFNQDLSSWGEYLGSVEDMHNMFHGCETFNQDLSSWKLSNVKNMSAMFDGCTVFNQDLSSWGPYLRNVKDISYMFNNCKNFNQDLSSWAPYLNNVTDMLGMFYNCNSFNQDLSNWEKSLPDVKGINRLSSNRKKNNW
jgi:surface protein